MMYNNNTKQHAPIKIIGQCFQCQNYQPDIICQNCPKCFHMLCLDRSYNVQNDHKLLCKYCQINKSDKCLSCLQKLDQILPYTHNMPNTLNEQQLISCRQQQKQDNEYVANYQHNMLKDPKQHHILTCKVCECRFHQKCIEMPYNQIINTNFNGVYIFICNFCLKKKGFARLQQTKLQKFNKSKQALFFKLKLNTNSPLHIGWFHEEVIRSLSKETINKSTEIDKQKIQANAEKVLDIKTPYQLLQLSQLQVFNVLLQRFYQDNGKVMDINNFHFLIKWKNQQMYKCSWQDQGVVMQKWPNILYRYLVVWALHLEQKQISKEFMFNNLSKFTQKSNQWVQSLSNMQRKIIKLQWITQQLISILTNKVINKSIILLCNNSILLSKAIINLLQLIDNKQTQQQITKSKPLIHIFVCPQNFLQNWTITLQNTFPMKQILKLDQLSKQTEQLLDNYLLSKKPLFQCLICSEQIYMKLIQKQSFVKFCNKKNQYTNYGISAVYFFGEHYSVEYQEYLLCKLDVTYVFSTKKIIKKQYIQNLYQKFQIRCLLEFEINIRQQVSAQFTLTKPVLHYKATLSKQVMNIISLCIYRFGISPMNDPVNLLKVLIKNFPEYYDKIIFEGFDACWTHYMMFIYILRNRNKINFANCNQLTINLSGFQPNKMFKHVCRLQKLRKLIQSQSYFDVYCIEISKQSKLLPDCLFALSNMIIKYGYGNWQAMKEDHVWINCLKQWQFTKRSAIDFIEYFKYHSHNSATQDKKVYKIMQQIFLKLTN